jgi:hypothetical protein
VDDRQGHLSSKVVGAIGDADEDWTDIR